nr:reverse transcriptase domain-containing protein [Tanacetum cinerariifolium]
MAKEDEEKIAFITCQGIFSHPKMPFGLKIVRSSLQAFGRQHSKTKSAEIRRKVTAILQTLKKCTKKSDFQWTTEAEVAFKQMKQLIAELPTIIAPMEKEELIVYLAGAREAAMRFRFDATNNEADYEALIAGLRIAEQMGIKNLQVPKSENKKADALSKIASTSFTHLTKQVLVKELKEKSINEAEVLAVVGEEKDTWMTPIYNYHTGETLPAEKEKARAVRLIPAEIGMPTLRIAEIDMIHNDEALEINTDLLEERREQAAIRKARSKAKMEKYYNYKVHNTSLKPGDLGYRNNDANHAKDSGKLCPKWEGPYKVTEALGNEAYRIRDRNEKLLPRT